jgi:sn-glycerol 3-phosphate transport system ATP-binding protein
MADQVILMRDGRVEQAAAPDQIYARPATTFAAKFIGTPPMNILTAAPDLTPDLAPDMARELGGASLLLGVRPEDVVLGDSGLLAHVQSAEFLGADTVVTCLFGSQTLTVRVPGKAALAAGSAIHLSWRPEHVHYFDARSGARRDDVGAPAADGKTGLVQSFA